MLKLDPEDQQRLADGEATRFLAAGVGSAFIYFEKLAAERLPDLMRLAWAERRAEAACG